MAFVVLESSLSLFKITFPTFTAFITSTAPPEWSASKCVKISSSIFLMPLSLKYLFMIESAWENVFFEPGYFPCAVSINIYFRSGVLIRKLSAFPTSKTITSQVFGDIFIKDNPRSKINMPDKTKILLSRNLSLKANPKTTSAP